MKSIPTGSEVNLWFEDDLFCQCNLWFIINLLSSVSLKANFYLVRPTSDSWMGFGSMNLEKFAQAYENRTQLNAEQLETFKQLWQIYSNKINGDMKSIASKLSSLIPRIESVINAHLDRVPPNNRPLNTLKNIIEENEDKSFPTIFKKFSEIEGIYGFGDTSIKRMYDKLMQQD